jgi:serine/threonine protein kinase
MELLDGGNFSEYYNSHKDLIILKKLVNDVLNGIAFLHKKNIIHRDIKPANILIKETNEGPVAKITDFGISKGVDSSNTSSTSALIVSIPFMAPEQINGKKYGINGSISNNLDLWTFGVSLYEILTGKVLFKQSDQDTSEQIMSNIMAPELPEKINDLPSPFREIITKCLVKDARFRAQKAEELLDLLNDKKTNKAPAVFATPSISETVFIPKPEIIQTAPVKPKKSLFLEETADAESSAKNIVDTMPIKKQRSILPIVSIGLLLILITAGIYYFLDSNEKSPSDPPLPNQAQQPAALLIDSSTKTNSNDSISAVSTVSNKGKKEKTVDQPEKARVEKTVKGEKEEHKSLRPLNDEISSTVVTLEITSTEDCRVLLNNAEFLVLKGKVKRLKWDPGKYLMKATSSFTGETIYSNTITVEQGKTTRIKIQ